jgi:TRAP-type transport system small permease protein
VKLEGHPGASHQAGVPSNRSTGPRIKNQEVRGLEQTKAVPSRLSVVEKRITEISRYLHFAGQFAIILMMLLTVFSAIGRYFFKYPIPGSVELTCLLMVMMTFLLTSYTQAIRGHINIPIIIDFLPQRGKHILDAFGLIIMLVLSVLGCIQSIKQGIFIASTHTYTAVLHLPYTPFYYLVSVCWAMLAVMVFIQLLQSLIKVVK